MFQNVQHVKRKLLQSKGFRKPGFCFAKTLDSHCFEIIMLVKSSLFLTHFACFLFYSCSKCFLEHFTW